MDVDANLWQTKATAFLHDPPHKALLLGQRIAHEEVARSLVSLLGLDVPDEAWARAKAADCLAAAADRIDFPPGTEAGWWKRPVLRHPLSGEVYDLGSLAGVEVRWVNERVKGRMEEARATCGGDVARLFLYLWRRLAEDLKRHEPAGQGLGTLWDLLPADTRLPHHTIWHHNRLGSALAGALPRPSLVVMSIGPVQDFNAVARKTSDLWAGSWILSYLAWQGMKVIADRFGPDAVLFPDLCGQPWVDLWLWEEKKVPGVGKPDERQLATPSLPNRWVALLPVEAAREAAEAAAGVVRQGWQELVDRVRDLVAEADSVVAEVGQWRRQQGWLEVYWSVFPWPVSGGTPDTHTGGGIPREFRDRLDDLLGPDPDFDGVLRAFEISGRYRPNAGTYYGRMYSVVDRAHRSRKTLRDFVAGYRGEPGYKCTLCGEREPLTDGKTESSSYRSLVTFWERLASALPPGVVEAEGRERLCTVCLTKRLAPVVLEKTLGISPRFPSTSEVAVTPFKMAVVGAAAGEFRLREALTGFLEVVTAVPDLARGVCLPCTWRAIRRLQAQVPGGIWETLAHLDGEWFFPETYASEETRDKLGARLASTRESLMRLRQEADRAGLSPPTPYLAMLCLDGDYMGRWVTGTHERLPALRDTLHPDVVAVCREAFGDEVLVRRKPLSPALQGSISAALQGFSQHVVRYVVEVQHAGKVVYAGGDDVLAMVPLVDALRLADALQRAFREPALVANGKVYLGGEALERVGSGDAVHLGMGVGATASAGLAIAHHRQPLTQGLEAARRMEERAKAELGRAAFSVATLKRSGERGEAGAPWSVAEKLEVIPFLEEIVSLFRSGELSPRFVNRFQTERDGLAVLPSAAWRRRVEYLLRRHMSEQPRDSEQARDKAAGLAANLLLLHEATTARKNPVEAEKDEIAGVQELLALAAFIARHTGRGAAV